LSSTAVVLNTPGRDVALEQSGGVALTEVILRPIIAPVMNRAWAV